MEELVPRSYLRLARALHLDHPMVAEV